MTRQNGSIIGEQIKGANQPGMWTPSDAQQRALTGEWGGGLGTIRYLLVGGGGGGGGARPSEINAGGGGGGGVVTGTETLYEGRKYDIQVAGPGSPGSTYTPGGRGGSSEFETTTSDAPPQYPGTSFKHVAYGGGGGCSYHGNPSNPNFRHGASGGGASSNGQTTAGGGLNPTIGGSPNTMPSPIVSPDFPDYTPGTTQGYNGGATASPPTDRGGGGGGGAGSPGGNASGQSGGPGGDGFASDITGSTVYYGGGGGGGGPTAGGGGGPGGGGNGAGPVPTSDGVNGDNATYYGGGGGGAATRPGNPSGGRSGGKGFPGIVILRYPNAFELDLSDSPQAPTNVDSNYNVKIVDQGSVGSDTYVAFGGSVNDIKFKRKY